MLKNPRNFHRSQNTSGHLSYSCFFSIKPCLVMVEMVLKTGAEMKKCAKIQPSQKMKPFFRKTEHIWPAYSPDLSPMDFSFWSYVFSHVIRCQPATIQELKMIVSDFISNMEPDYLRKIARQTRRRAEFCVSQNGGHFEHLLKKKCN